MNRRAWAALACPYHAGVTATPSNPEPALLRTLWLPVGDGHELLVQEFGSASGTPAVVLHGGPGSGSSPMLRRYFDATRYRVICVDQRGSGASRPAGATQHNTTAHLLADLRLLRQHLGLENWLVCGGSWGAALAVAYAAAEPAAVQGLLLRSCFLARRADVDHFFDGSAARCPPAWAQLVAATTRSPAVSMLDKLTTVFRRNDAAEVQAACLAWWAWERALASGHFERQGPTGAALLTCINRYRVQIHYLAHDCWLTEPPLLARCASLPRVPTLIIQAQDDAICPPVGSAALHANIPGSKLIELQAGGHDPSHPAMAAATRAALDSFAATGHFGAST